MSDQERAPGAGDLEKSGRPDAGSPGGRADEERPGRVEPHDPPPPVRREPVQPDRPEPLRTGKDPLRPRRPVEGSTDQDHPSAEGGGSRTRGTGEPEATSDDERAP